MQMAVSAWWNSDGTDPASKHTYTPCEYNTEKGKPHVQSYLSDLTERRHGSVK